MKYSHLLKLKEMMHKAAISLADVDALDAVELFPLWAIGKVYDIGERIRYGEKLYKCVQSHTSQSDWTPDVTPALWTEVTIEEWPEWVQPTGAQDAYNMGDKVSHNGKHWVSQYDANTWEPGVFGWEQAE